ncbi:DUF4031 domain-containing protein [Agrobacterium pusense]|uniref:DUF4031 domain-containing protein n=1 Tax=Agrobacterium pusense TaxID=648995 RepID=UPI000890F4D6|nr:DUF4031 domain-containing protein [Agrobacterium pusense]OOO15628.1 hypothetical protein BTE56_24070 [Agrobacterium pusense]WKD47094.1 DUF4031 domain-containing protein [Agrobacterium pusense]SDF17308.1 Protein of unknown function [Agrobacterium pusense]
MSVYVDDVRHKFGNMVMCHLWADTDDELLAMVDRIGVQRKWIQGHKTLSFGKHRDASWVHFDISLSKKALAIAAGAILTDEFGPVIHTSNLKIVWGEANNRPDIVERARSMIIQIEEIRTGRAMMAEEAAENEQRGLF